MTTERTSRAALAPVDVEAGLARAPFALAGRVLSVDAASARVVLGDALAERPVVVQLLGAGASADAGALEPGDHAVLDVSALGPPLVARVLERHPAPTGRAFAAGSDAARGHARGLVARARAAAAVRRFFEAERFVEVETPSMLPSPGLDVHLDAFEVSRGPTGAPRWLSTSPEYQMKRLLVRGVPRCFQLARCFRAGERGAQHEPEFTMLEWYRAFAGMADVMADTERLVRAVAAALGAGGDGRGLSFAGRACALGPEPFERLTVAGAFERFAGLGRDDVIAMSERDEAGFFRVLIERVEPGLAATGRPVFLTHWPVAFASLARRSGEDPAFAERFELYACGVELCNGFGELTDPVEQRARFEADQRARAELGKPVYPVDERFVRALEEGMPPAAGNALGFDRLVAVAVGAARLQDVVAIPDAELA